MDGRGAAGFPAAAIFDLDGVVTFTARVHLAAWKALFDGYLQERASRAGEPFRPFEVEDFHAFVDGRPRYEGVREFLASRGISLPFGDPSDPPERETICGVGNRKNELFRNQLRQQGVDVDRHAERLIRELRAAGTRVGMASSSKNAEAILERAGLIDLFDARVDGLLSERAGLPGKPAPDIFLACLERLGGEASDAMVVEDAAVGVQAGRAGGFGVVLGVDRGGNWIRLREHGADWIVGGFEDVSTASIAAYFRGRRHARPNALAAWPEVERELAGRRLALFLDYDGTLTPIVDRPDLARLSGEMRQAVRGAAGAWPTTIVSGRGREDVAALVGIDSLTYAASHGFDVAGPAGSDLRLEVDPEIVPRMAGTADELRARTDHIPGVLVEDKKFSIAVHYRLAPEERLDELEAIVDEVVMSHTGLKKTRGKKVLEVRPARDWDKGSAVLWLMDALGLNEPDVLPLFIGDDTTDEDAFRALERRGLGVVVMEIPRPTAARYALQNVEEVGMLLRRLSGLKQQRG